MEIQRARLIAAAAWVACEQGAANLTVANVVEQAGVSRRTFYEIFDCIEDCLLATLDDALTRACERVLASYTNASGSWRVRVRAGLGELLLLFDEQPHAARLLLVEWPASGPRALEVRRRTLARIASTLDEGRLQARGGGPPWLTAEGTVGAVASVLQGRVLERRGLADDDRSGNSGNQPETSLSELLGPLMSMIVLPYLGAAAARRELSLPGPVRRVSQGEANGGAEQPSMRDLGIRLTYRTTRVLAAIAAQPGASNRQIAEAAGIADQGQISKLLVRLRERGLVESNEGHRPVRGEPNAWTLTEKGRQLQHSLLV